MNDLMINATIPDDRVFVTFTLKLHLESRVLFCSRFEVYLKTQKSPP